MTSTGPNAGKAQAKKACISCHQEFTGEIKTCPNDGTTLTVIQAETLVGKIFADKYEILDVIGGGGMGLVYQARHQFMNRIVAIKVLHRSSAGSTDAIKRFQVEAQAASALSMPHIISVFDFGVSPDGLPYMVMDFLEGPSLSALLEQEEGGRLPAGRAVPIFIQVASALAHAHSKGILHRDIKPSNIVLINLEGQADFVKIVDFGIAKMLHSSELEAANLTRTGEVFGSPMYMSPEQIRGLKLDARTDIYSLGSVMYRALSGETLFEGGDALQIMYSHVAEMPAPITSTCPEVPQLLEAIVFKCLAKDPDERYQSMADLTEDLRRFQSGRPGAVAAGAASGSTLEQGDRPPDRAPPTDSDETTSKAEPAPNTTPEREPLQTMPSQTVPSRLPERRALELAPTSLPETTATPPLKEMNSPVAPVNRSSASDTTISLAIDRRVAKTALIGIAICAVIAAAALAFVKSQGHRDTQTQRKTATAKETPAADHARGVTPLPAPGILEPDVKEPAVQEPAVRKPASRKRSTGEAETDYRSPVRPAPPVESQSLNRGGTAEPAQNQAPVTQATKAPALTKRPAPQRHAPPPKKHGLVKEFKKLWRKLDL